MACAPAVHACINSVGTDHAGRRFHADWYIGEDMTDSMRKQYRRDSLLSSASSTIDQARAKPDFGNLSNLGVLLIYQGQYTEAARLFLSIERLFPGHHETAANFGTALELMGQDQAALRWIRIGIARNQDEHLRTEWLHVRILESKIALAKDPGFLKNHSVARVRFATVVVPPIPAELPAGNDGKPVKPWALNQALSYQLFERTQFVGSKDPVVANLLQDWATLNLAGGAIENADALYKLAVTYGASEDALMKERRAFIRRTLATAKTNDPYDFRCAICEPPPLPQ
jgi:tetratricopeptide (TPR) repeat protein